MGSLQSSQEVWNFAIPFNLWGETYLSEDSSINCFTFRHVDLKSIFRNELCNKVEYQSQRNHADPSKGLSVWMRRVICLPPLSVSSPFKWEGSDYLSGWVSGKTKKCDNQCKILGVAPSTQ